MPELHKNKYQHNRIAGGVYLCQVNDHVSCGACCGLYNLKGITKRTLSEILMERTEIFNRTPREMNAILAFGERNQEKIPKIKK